MAVDMLSYIERDSIIHRLSGTTKLIGFLLWSSAAMLTYDTRVLIFLFIASLILFKSSRVLFKDISFLVYFMLIFLSLNTIAIYLFSPQEGVRIYESSTVLIPLGGHFDLTAEELFYLANIMLKYITVIPAALLFIATTNPSEFASSLHRIGVNYKIGYSISIAMRYIPDIQRDYRTIAMAQQARGIDLSNKEKLSKRVKNALTIVTPLIFSSLERIEQISNVMDLRGFGKQKKRTWYAARSFRKNDVIALVIIVVFFCASMVITYYDGSRFYNPFH
ncbi:energy-coupling factor transporter transmembrane component T family protein [Aureibacillus halotolerans]|uniref:Energy-coupling factor transport system permease protein n=1 Tax=Aureibacillus halotolerans TaxID=1508390 RepID=A0A4R6UHI5_9BACI|nr:energy-coupling factor transporter transmembrane component T [Aureibacillus halotolerans]TDQ42614.1 energy-coupling factor transport system permease protein [Aureibacillus halotolerans]